MSNQPNGNEPNENEISREEKVANQKVQVFYNKEDTEFKSPVRAIEPVGLEGEALVKWRGDRDNEIKMKRSASDGYDENAVARKEIAIDKEEFEKTKRNFKKEQEEYNSKKTNPIKFEEPDFNKILAEKSGKPINSKSDIREIIEDDPDIYHEANMEYQRQNIDSLATSFKSYNDIGSVKKVESALFRGKVETQGINFDRLQAFAKHRGFPMNEFTLKSFKLENNIKSPINNINKSIPNNIEINWIPSGDRKFDTTAKTLLEEFPTQAEMSEHVRKERLKPLAEQDPRVIEAMK